MNKVKAGEEVEITSRGKVIARLVPEVDESRAARMRLASISLYGEHSKRSCYLLKIKFSNHVEQQFRARGNVWCLMYKSYLRFV